MCSCENSWMIGWLRSLSHHLSDPANMLCSYPSRLYGTNILKSSEEDFCVDPVKRTQIISVTTVMSAAILLILLGLSLYKMRIIFYKRWKFQTFDRDECVGEDMDYDVYFCCSSEDDDQHGIRIVELIESKGYRVCYHERDFRPGQLILDNIADSIERSKRTICLISEHFLHR